MPLSRRRKIGYAAVAVPLALVLAEAGARLVLALRPPAPLVAARVAGGAVGTEWFDLLVPDVGDPAAGARLYLPDPDLFWTLRPGFRADLENVCYGTTDTPVTWRVTIDEHGRRRTGGIDRGGAGPRVVCVGDSVTFGFRVDDDEPFPARLAGALADRGRPGATVFNLGVPGYSSHQGRRLLESALPDLDPDIVLIAFGANDLEADVRSDAAKSARNATLAARAARLVSGLAIVRLVRGRPATERTTPEATPRSRRVAPEETVRNLRGMIRATRAAGATPVLLDLVFVGDLFGATIEQLGREEGCPTLDGRAVLRDALADLLSGRAHAEERAALDRFWSDRVREYRRVYYDAAYYDALFADPVWNGLLRYLLIEPVHPNRLGHRVLAEAIADRLVR